MRLAPLALISAISLLPLTGCPNDDDDTGVPDSGGMDSGGLDAKTDGGNVDSGEEPDTGVDQDTGVSMDAETDSGVENPGVTMFPGVGVEWMGSRIDIGVDTFSSVNTKLTGIARERTMFDSARSYVYTLPTTTMTIWYANTNLDDDDSLPNDVDATDEVLWIAVEDGFPGTTPEDISLDSNRADVEGAYGPPPHTVDIVNPMGTLAQYYTTGILVAYEPNDDVRTITISRAYLMEPNGTIEPSNARVSFGANELKGFIALGNTGTPHDDVIALLGMPDAEGTVTLNGTQLDTLSYGFIGIEVFFSQISDNTLFFVVHPPFYGTTSTGIGMGSTHAEMDNYLSGFGYEPGPSSNAQLICYDKGSPPGVGVTYTAADDLVSSITMPLVQCP